jgi:serine/threonine protein kinase
MPDICLIGEYVVGINLSVLIGSQDYSLDHQLIHKIARDIASGMAYLHQSNVIHSSLKPTNILVGYYCWDIQLQSLCRLTKNLEQKLEIMDFVI